MADTSVHAEIDLSALRHNLGVVRRHAPASRVMAVVKAQAYGHGIMEIAGALQAEVDALAVARMEEAVSLREGGIAGPLVVLEGPLWPQDLAVARRHDLQLVVHDAYQLGLVQADGSREPLDCWLKVDTGMHRLGVPVDQAQVMLDRLQALPHIRIAGVMTHLANADDRDDPTTTVQLERMRGIFPQASPPRSSANSAGILAWPDSHCEWVRPGLMLYGASPLAGQAAVDLDLKPVMTLSAPLIAIKGIPAGARVGYGGTWSAPEAMPLGIVGIGYGDGYPRHIGAARVGLHGRQPEVLGRVSMDMLAIDLRELPEARVGDRVVLWGQGGPAVDEVARWADTIPYTLFCGVTERVSRVYGD